MKWKKTLYYSDEEKILEFGTTDTMYLYIKGWEVWELICPKCHSKDLIETFRTERDASPLEPTHGCQYRSYHNGFECLKCGWKGRDPVETELICRIITADHPEIKKQEIHPELKDKYLYL